MTRYRRRPVPHRVSPDDLAGGAWISPKAAKVFLTQRARPPSHDQVREVLAQVNPIHHNWLLSAIDRANRIRRRRRNNNRYSQPEQPLGGDAA